MYVGREAPRQAVFSASVELSSAMWPVRRDIVPQGSVNR